MERTSTKEKILRAAEDLFAQHGYPATTTRMIAESAQISESTLFRHFRSKQILFNEILQKIIQAGFSKNYYLENASKYPREAIRMIVSKVLKTAFDYPVSFRLLRRAILEQYEGFEDMFVERHVMPVVYALTECFDQLKIEGKCKVPVSSQMAAELLVNQLIATVESVLFIKTPVLSKYEQDDLTSFICGIYCH